MIRHPAKIKDGKISLQPRETFDAAVKGLPDGDYEITVGKKKKSRTRGREGELGNQDGAFFGPILDVVATEIFQTKDMKEAYYRTLEAVSFRLERNPKGGPPTKKLIHVSDLERDGMRQLIDNTLIWAAQEHGVFIDNPDPKKSVRWRERFKREYLYQG